MSTPCTCAAHYAPLGTGAVSKALPRIDPGDFRCDLQLVLPIGVFDVITARNLKLTVAAIYLESSLARDTIFGYRWPLGHCHCDTLQHTCPLELSM